jgi:aminomethyltransferase
MTVDSSPPAAPQRTVLTAIQGAAGAKLVDFHGWEMPVQFAGIAPEHRAVRTAAGAFDLGHMGRLRLTGAPALAFLERRVCRALASMAAGAVRYGLVLAADGTVEDDVLVSREGPEAWHVVVNAGNREKILGLWRPELPAGVVLEDRSAAEAMIAVQGPAAPGILAGLGLDPKGLKYYAFRDVAWQGTTVRVSRTGYTGEDGAELFVASGRAEALWTAVLAAGVTPCGLGARDTLRLEAGMPLYGNELDRTVTPVEAGLGFAVNPAGGFIGAERVLEQMTLGPERRLVGLRMKDKRVPRSHYPVLAGGQAVGVVTSGTLSPTLGSAIGMAYVPAHLSNPGTALAVDVRGVEVGAEVVTLPFYRRPK